MATESKSVFETLRVIDVSEHTEEKNGLTYLSWAWAWDEVKQVYPLATYTIYETTNPQGYVCNYFTDGKTCWVKTGVTINGIEHIEELPVMDFKNKSIPLESVTSFDVNKAIQRSLTKALARHGLGLYIYAGEDLPEGAEEKEPKEKKPTEQKKPQPASTQTSAKLTEQQLKLLDTLDIKVKQTICEKERISSLSELSAFNASKWITYCQGKGMIING